MSPSRYLFTIVASAVVVFTIILTVMFVKTATPRQNLSMRKDWIMNIGILKPLKEARLTIKSRMTFLTKEQAGK